jgi:transposase
MQENRKQRLIDIDRNQNVLRAVDVESLIDESHHARAVWDFVSRLDLTPFYSDIRSLEGEAGRPAWDPRLLVSMWIYAYSQGIGSAREIERRCSFDPAFQWLTGMGCINHHTLSSFRVGQKAKLDELFEQTLALLALDGLITLERVAHDGTKIKAFASDNTFRRERRIQEFLKVAREQIDAMGDPRTESDGRSQRAKERVARERKEKLESALTELESIRKGKKGTEEKTEARASVTDPQARIMKQPGGGYAPSYNAQISTDSANGIVVSAYLTQSGADYDGLLPSLEKIEEAFGELPKQVVADKGYAKFSNIVALDEKNVDLFVPLVDQTDSARSAFKRHGIEEDFKLEKFKYDPVVDSFTCPAGKRLGRNGSERRNGRVKILYAARTRDCQACAFKPKCCPNAKRARAVSRNVEHQSVTALRAKMETEQAKQIYRTRSATAEFSNAWLKSKIKLRQFCVRGREKAEIELRWACMALNVQHWGRLAWA